MTTPFTEAHLAALAAMDKLGRPADLVGMAADHAKWIDGDITVDANALLDYLTTAGVNDPLWSQLRTQTVVWDAAVGPGWADSTPANTQQRRAVITRRLNLDEPTTQLLNTKIPVAGIELPTVIAREWTPWYTDEIRRHRSYYWNHYIDHLQRNGWAPDARASLDIATDRVVERLTDPTQPEAYKAKGLVVGYVQSGKTANFTGVLAKAIDAGYRLIIVLTGTTDLLRAQTQRRLDMELVGRENILAGIDENDPLATDGLDYQLDKDWIGRRFLEHGTLPRRAGRPNIHRLTTQRGDYKSLQQGIIALDFPRRDEDRPIYDPANLFTTDARLAVVKKNASVLTKLVADLRKSAARTEDLPVLIVDDESDQASVNTSNPKKWQEDQKHRTSINRLIAQLLGMLPRAQYIGYTATPFANVFIDPNDAEDIFPNDFLISLARTPGYMGSADFHDLDSNDDARNFANSNEKAHIRILPPAPSEDDHDLREAMDAYVLAGAIKLYRRENGQGEFRHHTMLVHENMKTAVHREQAERIRRLWDMSGYYTSTAHERLRILFERDHLKVMQARSDGAPVPDDFAALAPYLAKTIAQIGESGNPVLVVNSDKIEGEDLDFDQNPVWRILVGGNKLARGFTVEGLTVSYYRRVTKQGDTLMQMGRWFGYRKGYRDLVRLYVTKELYDAFEAVCRDEEYFRSELRRYSEWVDGRPQVTPAQVPPLVAQHLPWLKPTATNKMYNARLTERRSPGRGIEPTAYPILPNDIADNVETMLPLIETATQRARFKLSKARDYPAYIGLLPHAALISALDALRWADNDNFAPDLRWLKTLTPQQIEDWAIIVPQLTDQSPTSKILGNGPFSLHKRQRRRSPYFGAISDPKHRLAADRIAGVDSSIVDPDADAWRGPGRGSVMLYPVFEGNEPLIHGDEATPGSLVICFRITAPPSTQPRNGRLITFVTQDSRRPTKAIVDAS
ncbi:Z1 domain-containing protein [Amycolatopsis pigmentata]|uniref:Z1 domain-containing protein n=1 Tax=Amycolatopsis pigmentata TaxID=450801 RepID=A0ABW5FRQ6_9PSEU